MSYLRKRGTDDIFVSTPNLAARPDMLPVTDDQAKAVMAGKLSLKGTDFSQTVTEDGKKLVTKFLRKHGTNELFLYTEGLAQRNDMVPCTEDQAALIRGGNIDFQKLENVQVDINQPPPNPNDGRVDMTETPPPPTPNTGEATPPAPQGAGTATTPPAAPEGGQGSGPTGPAGEGAGGPGLSDAKQEQIAKLGAMNKDELVLFAKDKFQVDIDKRKSEEKIREIVTVLIQDNP